MNISWIKLDVNLLDDTKIKIIRSHPDGNAIVILWIGLLCLAMKSARPGIIEISDGIPYTVDDLSSLFNLEKKTVELGLALFAKYQMISLFDGNTLEIINFCKYQSIEEIERKRELTRLRVKDFREKRKCNELLTHTKRNVTLTDKIRNREDKIKKESRGIFQIPTIQEISDYCQQRKNKINPQLFFEHYNTNGWMVGKNKMKNWKSAIITWELRENNNANSSKQGFKPNTHRQFSNNRELSPGAAEEAERINADYYREKAAKGSGPDIHNAK